MPPWAEKWDGVRRSVLSGSLPGAAPENKRSTIKLFAARSDQGKAAQEMVRPTWIMRLHRVKCTSRKRGGTA